MWPVSESWLAALAQPYTLYTRVASYLNGEHLADIPISEGAVEVTATNRVRRRLTITAGERDWWPTEVTDPLAPYGQELRAWRGIIGPNGELLEDAVPVFTGRIQTVGPRQRRSGEITVVAADRFTDVNDAEFESPRVATAGVPITAMITTLIREVRPDASVVDLTGSAATVPDAMMWDSDRGGAVDELAAAIGAEVYADPQGDFVIRPVPVLGSTWVWQLTVGEAGTIIKDATSKSRAGVANRLVVRVERPGAVPLLVVVSDDNPHSPIRYGGPYGKVVRHMSSPLITSEAQAQIAGAARLARSIGLARTREIECLPNPALEAGDVALVAVDDEHELHIADSFTVGLSATDTMTIKTRSTQVSADDS